MSHGLTFEEVRGQDAGADALLARHHALMRSSSPEDSCHVMTAEELRASGARVFVGRDHVTQAQAIGAYLDLGEGRAELKSMHCHARYRGKGAGRALLQYLTNEARRAGMTSLWLETGRMPLFAPARSLYKAEGFQDCPAFGTYVEDPHSVFMQRPL